MQQEQSRNISFDDRIDSYSPFFDHSWAKHVNSIAEPAKKLDTFVFDLLLSLKGVSRAFSLPHIAVDAAKSFYDGHRLGSLQNSDFVRVMNYVAERLDQKIVFAGVQKSEFKKAILDPAFECVEKTKNHVVEFPRQQLWDEMLQVVTDDPDNRAKNELRMGIRQFLPSCYASLFFAYEHFLAQCIHTRSSTTHWVTSDEFKKECRNSLGHVFAGNSWFDHPIDTAKLVRNALVHVGGKVTKQLKNKKHGIEVVDDRLQILPADVVDLYNEIKPRVTALVEWAVSLPEFQ